MKASPAEITAIGMAIRAVYLTPSRFTIVNMATIPMARLLADILR